MLRACMCWCTICEPRMHFSLPTFRFRWHAFNMCKSRGDDYQLIWNMANGGFFAAQKYNNEIVLITHREREKKSQLSSISFVSIGNSFIHLFFYCYNYFERVINTPEKRQKPETDILPLTARRKRVSEWASDQKNQTLLMNEFYNLQCGLWNVVDKLTVRCRKMYFISFDVECCPAFSSNSRKSNSDWHNWTIFFMRKLSVVHHWAN